jgi:hypothetical protein
MTLNQLLGKRKNSEIHDITQLEKGASYFENDPYNSF